MESTKKGYGSVNRAELFSAFLREEFTGFCMGNVLKYCSRWRKKDGLQDLKKAKVYLEWAIEWEEKHGNLHRD